MISTDTPSNEVLNRLNRLYDAKRSGGMTQDDFSNLLIKTGDLVANCVKNGKISEEAMLEIEAHLPSEKFFRIKHARLDEAKKTFVEGNRMSLSEREMRFGGKQLELK